MEYIFSKQNFLLREKLEVVSFPLQGFDFLCTSLTKAPGAQRHPGTCSLCACVHDCAQLCVQGEVLWKTGESVTDIDSCWNLAGSWAESDKKLT